MNIWFGSGNITKPLELRTTQSGKHVLNLSLACNEGKDKTEFVDCVAWDKAAELISQYCEKGQRLTLYGRLQTTKYEDSKGITKYKTEVVVDKFDFPPKQSMEAQDRHFHAAAGMPPETNDPEDEIPF